MDVKDLTRAWEESWSWEPADTADLLRTRYEAGIRLRSIEPVPSYTTYRLYVASVNAVLDRR